MVLYAVRFTELRAAWCTMQLSCALGAETGSFAVVP